MQNWIVFALEPLEQRYTQQWYQLIPQLLTSRATADVAVMQLCGEQSSSSTSAGAFLDFADTNRWKSTQLVQFLNLLQQGQIGNTDRLLFTDAWNPVILQIRYIQQLLGYDWQLHGIWHAGHYDPSDLLGQRLQPEWSQATEQALFWALDRSYFGTEFHRQMFINQLQIPESAQHRCVRSGQPHDLLVQQLQQMPRVAERQRQVCWPHRISSDKQPDIADDLAQLLDAPVLVTQRMQLSKQQYYQQLQCSSVVFSCSLHENLGISIMEGCLAGCLPLVPDRASYSEMYEPEFVYPSSWTSSWHNYVLHQHQLVQRIHWMLDHTEQLQPVLQRQVQRLQQHYLSADIMFREFCK